MMAIFTISNVLISVTIFSICAFIASVFIGFNLPLYKNNLQIDDSLKDNDRFLNPMTTTFLKVYLFNVDNPDKVLTGDEIPQITEIGPFVYREIRSREIHDEEFETSDTFTMTETKTYEFDAEQSFPLIEKTEITIFNLAMKLTYDYATKMNVNGFADLCYKPLVQNNLFPTLTAKEIIFDGFTICNYPKDIEDLPTCGAVSINLYKGLCDSITNNQYTKQDNNGLWKMSLLGHINGKNNTYEIKNGADSVNERGDIVKVNNLSSLTNWAGAEDSKCNKVSSNEITMFPSTLNRNSTISMFSPDNCRRFEYEYYNDTIYEYLYSMDFRLKPTTFLSSEVDPKLDCYCPSKKIDEFDDESCFLDGVLNIKPCTEIPILLSFPYFLNAADKYKETVEFKKFGEDFQPNENLYQSYILIEKNTGITLESVQRLQYNVITKEIKKSSYLGTLKRAYLPVFWTEELTKMSSEGVSEIITDVYLSEKKRVNEGTRWGLIGTFLILSVASTTSLILYKRLLC